MTCRRPEVARVVVLDGVGRDRCEDRLLPRVLVGTQPRPAKQERIVLNRALAENEVLLGAVELVWSLVRGGDKPQHLATLLLDREAVAIVEVEPVRRTSKQRPAFA